MIKTVLHKTVLHMPSDLVQKLFRMVFPPVADLAETKASVLCSTKV